MSPIFKLLFIEEHPNEQPRLQYGKDKIYIFLQMTCTITNPSTTHTKKLFAFVFLIENIAKIAKLP